MVAGISSEAIQGICVTIAGRGVLIEGKTDAWKTDLALRLIDRGAKLVADGQVICRRQDGGLIASPTPDKAGRIEVRGLGIVELPYAEHAPVELLIVILEAPPRLPEDVRKRQVAGVDVPVLALGALDLAAAIKVELMMGKFPQ